MKDNNKLRQEEERIEGLKTFEKQAYGRGFDIIAGLDEVGRGPIAGPVVAGAVILPKDFFLPGVNDSKKLSAKKRLELANYIKNRALDWSVGYIFPPYLDEINILEATKQAMGNCLRFLNLRPNYLLIDALQLIDTNIEQLPLIKGDGKSISIACASIIAKVERDQSMIYYDELYPGYGFAKHKGYATKEHVKALAHMGPCSIHRASFEPVKSFIGGEQNVKQPSLFG